MSKIFQEELKLQETTLVVKSLYHKSIFLFKVGTLEITRPHIFGKYFENKPKIIDGYFWYKIKDEMRIYFQ